MRREPCLREYATILHFTFYTLHSNDGSAWPTLLNFGDIPVVADGAAELVFAIDCGAKVPFSLTTGRLGSLAVTATEPPTRSGEGMTTTESSEFLGNYVFPHERTVNDVKVHLDDPCTGWLCRTAGVSVDPSWLPHFSPDDSAELTATVTDCHSNAYLGCTWTGGAGITFSQEHSLSTTVTYDPNEPDIWTTNSIDLVTQFVGYTLTNHVHFTVGTTNEPPLRFSIGCQEIFFLNDAELGSTSNRAERIRPVTLNLTGPVGTNGTARLSVQGNVNPVLFQVEDGVTNRVTESTVFPLAVTNDFAHTGSCTIYVSCPRRGTGTITATFTPADGGEPLTSSATFRCIEPLRKLVTTEKKDGRYVNPSRLVMGTNAVLKVGANGPFSPSEVDWHVVSGSAQLVRNGWYATVTPTGTETVTVEARFNNDEIQPRFVLPVVQPRTIPVRAFVVEPPEGDENNQWSSYQISKMLDTANEIYTQVGMSFELVEQATTVGTTNDWNLALGRFVITNGKLKLRCSPACVNLLNSYTASDCIELYFIGSIVFSSPCSAITTPYGIIIGKKDAATTVVAHELGHALGLDDCYVKMNDGITSLPDVEAPVDRAFFINGSRDWGVEHGRGFYGTEDSRLAVAGSLLMHGVSSTDRADIADGMVLSLTRTMTNGTPGTFNAKVGAGHFKKTNAEVFSR